MQQLGQYEVVHRKAEKRKSDNSAPPELKSFVAKTSGAAGASALFRNANCAVQQQLLLLDAQKTIRELKARATMAQPPKNDNFSANASTVMRDQTRETVSSSSNVNNQEAAAKRRNNQNNHVPINRTIPSLNK